MKNKIITLSFLLAGLLLFYQNCSKVGFTPASLESSSEINCVQGKKLGIWGNGGVYLGEIVAYSGDISAIENYNYYSASAHPINGPTPIGFELHNFFYEGPDGLMLNFYGNIDGGGSEANKFTLKIVTQNNNGADNLVFIDDPGSKDAVTVSKTNSGHTYLGTFQYWSNTDGAIIGPFSGEDFEIGVEIGIAGDLQGARFYSANGSSFNLGDTSSMSYLIKYLDYEDCK